MSEQSMTEKVSVNINAATLSEIDLLVDSGYYSNRSDFINQALRASLQEHRSTIDRLVGQKTGGDPWFLGMYGLTRRDIQEYFDEGRSFPIRGYGVLIIDRDCPEEQVKAVVTGIQVKGKVICAPGLKAHYGLK